MFAKVTAVLYFLACPNCTPEPFAAYFTTKGPTICEATARAQNATDRGRFYCEHE